MKPVDFRNETFASIQERLTDERLRVYEAMKSAGPVTTRKLAEYMGVAPEFIRPRVTELFQMEAVELVGAHGHEGVYRARLLGEWMLCAAGRKERETCGQQMQLL